MHRQPPNKHIKKNPNTKKKKLYFHAHRSVTQRIIASYSYQEVATDLSSSQSRHRHTHADLLRYWLQQGLASESSSFAETSKPKNVVYLLTRVCQAKSGRIMLFCSVFYLFFLLFRLLLLFLLFLLFFLSFFSFVSLSFSFLSSFLFFVVVYSRF